MRKFVIFVVAMVGLVMTGCSTPSKVENDLQLGKAAQSYYFSNHPSGEKYYLQSAGLLSEDLGGNNATLSQKQAIEAFLEKFRQDISWADLDSAQQDSWWKVESALELYHLQQRQAQDIVDKPHGCVSVDAHAEPGKVQVNDTPTYCSQ